MPLNKKRQISTDSDDEQRVVKKSKNQPKHAKKDLPKGTDDEGNPYWEVGNNRRIGPSQFKGTTLVNIREYYTAPDGELRPGKKVGALPPAISYSTPQGALPSHSARRLTWIGSRRRESRSRWISTTPSSGSCPSSTRRSARGATW